MLSVFYRLFACTVQVHVLYMGSMAWPLISVPQALYPLLIEWSMFRTLSASYGNYGQVSSGRDLIPKAGPERHVVKEPSIPALVSGGMPNSSLPHLTMVHAAKLKQFLKDAITVSSNGHVFGKNNKLVKVDEILMVRNAVMQD